MNRFVAELEDVEIIRAEDVSKHGSHDQSSHGNWANNGNVEDLMSWSFAEAKKQGVYVSAQTLTNGPYNLTIPKGLKNLHEDVNFQNNPEYKEALNFYTDIGFNDINMSLRDGKQRIQNLQKYTNDIDSLIKKTPGLSEDITVYKGYKLSTNPDLYSTLDDLQVGKGFRDNAYMSTSVDPTVAVLQFSTPNFGKVLRVKVPKGTKGIYVPNFFGAKDERAQTAREQEFILPRGSIFKVNKVSGKVIDVEVVNNVK